MAAITSDEDFSIAVGHLIDTGQLPVTGERRRDAPARKVYDQRPGELVDITPDTPTLEAALDAALAQQALEQARDNARTFLLQGKTYLRGQLEQASPAGAAAQVAVIKPIIDGNVFLTRRMTNLVALYNGAFGWTLDLNPVTAQNRQRYLVVVVAMISLET